MAFYRATGQAHKPQPPVNAGKNSTAATAQGGSTTKGKLQLEMAFLLNLLFFFIPADADRARKHGMEEFIAADPITFDHHTLFAQLQTLSLDWRLKDPFASLVSSYFS